MTRFRPGLCVLACAALAASLLVACGDDDDAPTPTSAPTSPTTRVQQPPTATPVLPTAVPTTPRCATADLALSAESGGGAAGTHFLSLILTNKSGANCILSGFPGVSLVDAAGQQVGKPADRNGAVPGDPVTLKPGEAAHATAGFPNYQNFPAGECSGPSTAIKVFPPDELTALSLNLEDYSCSGFAVQPIQPGKNEPGRS